MGGSSLHDMSASSALPIWKIHAEILERLGVSRRLVLVAPTGSGKTTQVPQMLLDGGVAGDRMVVVLQPRRVAARSVAARVAWERGGALGGEVGYQIRFDDHTSVGTRICFVTEGILLRWLQEDRLLAKIGAVVFDEFHERNLLSDVALALVKQLQREERPDLALVVMSATLEAEPVAAYLEPCPILHSEGRSFPVEVRYLALPDPRPMAVQAAEAVGRIVEGEVPGDILVFMPGRGEISGTLEALRGLRMGERLMCLPLHGELEPEEQDRAFAPQARRKVIVATNVAETSITIEGIRHVVDSGTARVARYDAARGVGTLALEPISRASAAQRQGRAGRTAPGTCHRLWTALGQQSRAERNTPEIQRSDLAEVVLLLHAQGIREAADFDWLDKPDGAAVERAERLLTVLGALEEGGISAMGRQMLRLPMHPRFSRLLIEAGQRGCLAEAALCAALVSGRDLWARGERDDASSRAARELFEESGESDFVTLMRAYDFAVASGFHGERCRAQGVNAHVARQVEQTFQQILQAARQQGLPAGEVARSCAPRQEEALRRCLLAGFVDQLAKRVEVGKGECELTEGRQGQLVRESVVQGAPYLVAASLREAPGRGAGPLTLLSLATAVRPEWVAELFPQHLSCSVEHLFDAAHKRVAAVKVVRYRGLVIEQKVQQRDLDPLASGRCLAEAQRAGAFELPLLDHRLRQFMARVNVVHASLPELEFAPFDGAAVVACLARAFAGLSLVKEAQAAPLMAAFQRHLEPGQVSWLDELVPLAIPWPDQRTVKVSYGEGVPEAQVKLQECFALQEHPVVCEGRLPVQLILGTPDGKRFAATADWPTFLAREWPKHRQAVAKKFSGLLWR